MLGRGIILLPYFICQLIFYCNRIHLDYFCHNPYTYFINQKRYIIVKRMLSVYAGKLRTLYHQKYQSIL